MKSIWESIKQLAKILACLTLGVGLALPWIVDVPPSASEIAIRDEVDLNASPDRVYEALVNDEEFSAFAGAAGHIEREAGGAFKLFGGRVTGRNIELVPNQLIVQAWRAESWPPGAYSIVRLELLSRPWGTRVLVDQQGIPPDHRKAQIAEWPQFYWDPLRKYLAL